VELGSGLAVSDNDLNRRVPLYDRVSRSRPPSCRRSHQDWRLSEHFTGESRNADAIGGKRLLDDLERADQLLSGRRLIAEPPQDLLPTASVRRLGLRLGANTATQPRWQHGCVDAPGALFYILLCAAVYVLRKDYRTDEQQAQGERAVPRRLAYQSGGEGTVRKGHSRLGETRRQRRRRDQRNQPKAQGKRAGRRDLAPKAAPREPEKVIPTVSEPVVTIADAISETITMIADTGSVSGEVVKPIAAINTTNPKPMLGTKTMIKNTEDFVAFGQANVEAFVKSGQIWAAGLQELMKQFATATKVSFDESASAFKAISSAKSVTEAMDLQSKFASSVVAKTLAESNKLIDASIKLTEQTLAPISARVTGAVETFGKAA
jgi:phasin family protein